jgi:hypothetical protein
MHPQAITLSAALILSLVGRPAAGPTPRILRELVCRGAANFDIRVDKDPSPYHNTYVRLALRYQPAPRPVGAGFENLAPGNCSWNPHNFSGIPPEGGLVYLDVPRTAQDYAGGTADTTIKAAERIKDAITVPRYLKVPEHYWVFIVDDFDNLTLSSGPFKFTPSQPVIAGPAVAVDSGGPAGKSTDRAGTSILGTGSLRDANRTLHAARVPLTFHEVVRKPMEYWLRFGARANSGVTAEYGIAPPIRKSGRLTFYQPFRWPVRRLSEKGFAAEYSTAPVRGLVQGKKYYFVINVPAGGPGIPAEEYSGEFWALAQHITVRFTRIDVLNDSDKLDSGEIVFEFHLAAGDRNTEYCPGQGVCSVVVGPMHWESGSKNSIDVTLSQPITTSRARVWVSGSDSDTPVTHTRHYNTSWTTTYGASGHNGDRNNARAELAFTVVPEQTVFIARNSFTLRSFDGYVLMYEVQGQAEAIWK